MQNLQLCFDGDVASMSKWLGPFSYLLTNEDSITHLNEKLKVKNVNLIVDERRFRPNICVKGNMNIMYLGISILNFLSSEMMIWVKILFEFLGSKITTHRELSWYIIKNWFSQKYEISCNNCGFFKYRRRNTFN